MAHSLVIGDQFELFGDGQIIDAGAAMGAVIRLGGTGSNTFDLGAGEPQQTVINSLLLDGERPVGRRTGNAQISLPIFVMAPGMRPLIAARELILAIIDQETWTLTLTLDGLEPTVYDCLRGKATMPIVLREMQQDVVQFTVTAQRLPFGRSDVQESITVPAPPGTPGGGSVGLLPSVAIADFEAGAGQALQGSAWFTSTTVKYVGNASTFTWGQSVMWYNCATFPTDLTGYRSVSFYVAVAGSAVKRTFGFSWHDDQNPAKAWGLQPVAVTLPGGNKWIKVSMSMTATKPPTGFHLNRVKFFEFGTSPAGVYLDHVVVDGVSLNVVGGSRGGVYEINDVMGSARAPINVDLSRPSGANITSGILHRPETVPALYTPLVELNPATPLDGRTLTLPVPAGQSGVVTDRWSGTYSIVLSIAALVGQAAQSRTTFLRIAQYHPAGGSDVVDVSRTYTPTEIGSAKYLYLGRIDLPIRDLPADTPGAGWTLALYCTGLSAGLFDSFTDLMFLDTEGETVVWQNSIAHPHVFLDEPDPVSVNHGALYNGVGHSGAVSIVDSISAMSGEPFGLDPGDNTMMVHCWDGATQMTITYTPRWHGLRY